MVGQVSRRNPVGSTSTGFVDFSGDPMARQYHEKDTNMLGCVFCVSYLGILRCFRCSVLCWYRESISNWAGDEWQSTVKQ